MFEHMEIEETINEDVVDYSYRRTIRADANHAGHRRQNRLEAVLPKISPRWENVLEDESIGM